ncbi:hypothetical protein HPB47_019847 [Ixodes persulcatus]|uniref:Uncharacterized protein n=1 Tax=Ixodes persulcatus TaxID=34615 RepID=A0AC60QHC6_IXOPE|nr:hypothetical protein HPB47_019847 [Ixodes persulcatus]
MTSFRLPTSLETGSARVPEHSPRAQVPRSQEDPRGGEGDLQPCRILEDLKVNLRLRGGFDAAQLRTVTVRDGVLRAAGISYDEACSDTLRVNIRQNTLTMSTPSRENALKYSKITNIRISTKDYEAAAYITAPEDTSKEIIHGRPEEETPEDIKRSLYVRSPCILHAQRMGNTSTIIIAFQGEHGGHVPKPQKRKMPGLRSGKPEQRPQMHTLLPALRQRTSNWRQEVPRGAPDSIHNQKTAKGVAPHTATMPPAQDRPSRSRERPGAANDNNGSRGGRSPLPLLSDAAPRWGLWSRRAIPVPLSALVRIQALFRFKEAAAAATTATAEPPQTAAGTRPTARPTTDELGRQATVAAEGPLTAPPQKRQAEENPQPREELLESLAELVKAHFDALNSKIELLGQRMNRIELRTTAIESTLAESRPAAARPIRSTKPYQRPTAAESSSDNSNATGAPARESETLVVTLARRNLAVIQHQTTVVNHVGLTLVTDPQQPTRTGNSVSMDTTPNLTFTKNAPDPKWVNTQKDLGSNNFIIATTLCTGPAKKRGRKLTMVEWDTFRQIQWSERESEHEDEHEEARNSTTDIEEWTAQLHRAVKQATKEIPEEAGLQTADSKLLHLWEARNSLQERKQYGEAPSITIIASGGPIPIVEQIKVLELRVHAEGRNNDTLKALEHSTQQTIRLIKRIANRRYGMREAGLIRLVRAFIIIRVVYVAPYLVFGVAEKRKMEGLIRRAYKQAIGIPITTPNKNPSSTEFGQALANGW